MAAPVTVRALSWEAGRGDLAEARSSATKDEHDLPRPFCLYRGNARYKDEREGVLCKGEWLCLRSTNPPLDKPLADGDTRRKSV